MAITTWDNSKRSTGMYIGVPSGSNAVSLMQISGTYNGGRTVTGYATSKRHAEFYIDFNAGADFAVGVSNSSHTLTNWLGSQQGVGYYSDGRVFANGGQIGSGNPTYTTGNIVQIEMDADAKTIQFRTAPGGAWTPAYNIPGTGPWFLHFVPQLNGSRVTVNGGDTTFDGSMSSGYSAWNASGELFNFSDKAAGAQLITPTRTAATAWGATNPGIVSARKSGANSYWEVTATTQSSTFSIGVADQTWNYASNTVLGGDNLGLGFFTDGTVKLNNVTLATIFTYTQGDVIRVAHNPVDRLIYFDKNNAGNWNNTSADPVAGTGGISYSTMTTSSGVAPAIGMAVVSPNQTVNAAFSSANWAYSAPSGYVSLDTVFAGPVLGVGKRRVYNAQVSTAGNYVSHWIGPNMGQTKNDPKTAYRGVYNGSGQTKILGVTEEATVRVSGKVVRLYDQLTGEFLGEYHSDALTGRYSIPALGRTSVYVIALDPGFQAQILDTLTPT